MTRARTQSRPICHCHGCRFEKPQLEHRIAELEQALRDAVAFVDRESAGDYARWERLLDG